MSVKEAVFTTNSPPPLPFYSQAIKCNGMVYCSGQVGGDPKTGKVVEGTIQDRTVSPGRGNGQREGAFALTATQMLTRSQRQILKNLSAILEAAGSSIDKVVKVGIFITSMDNFAAVNEVYQEFFSVEPKPVRVIDHTSLIPLSCNSCTRPGRSFLLT